MSLFGLGKVSKKAEIDLTREPLPKKRGEYRVRIDGGRESVSFRFGNAQHIGCRAEQQDAFGYSDLSTINERGVLAVLSDGMGGLANGRQISQFTVSSMLAMFHDLDFARPVQEELRAMAEKINRQVCAAWDENRQNSCGATLASAFFYQSRMYWACAGDSRVCLLRDGVLYQLNEDHHYLNQLFEACISGDLAPDKAKTDPQRGALTSYIGCPGLPGLDYNKKGFSMRRGDQYLLCTDGVYNAVSNAKLIECLGLSSPQRQADEIIRAVMEERLQGQDNATVMIIEYI